MCESAPCGMTLNHSMTTRVPVPGPYIPAPPRENLQTHPRATYIQAERRKFPYESEIFCKTDLREMQGHQEKGSDPDHL